MMKEEIGTHNEENSWDLRQQTACKYENGREEKMGPRKEGEERRHLKVLLDFSHRVCSVCSTEISVYDIRNVTGHCFPIRTEKRGALPLGLQQDGKKRKGDGLTFHRPALAIGGLRSHCDNNHTLELS